MIDESYFFRIAWLIQKLELGVELTEEEEKLKEELGFFDIEVKYPSDFVFSRL